MPSAQNMHCTKMKFSNKDFCSKCDQIRSFLRIWSHSLKKPLMENFIFLGSDVKFKTNKNILHNNEDFLDELHQKLIVTLK